MVTMRSSGRHELCTLSSAKPLVDINVGKCYHDLLLRVFVCPLKGEKLVN